MIVIALLSLSCVVWFAAQWLAMRSREAHAMRLIMIKQRLDAFNPSWRTWEGF